MTDSKRSAGDLGPSYQQYLLRASRVSLMAVLLFVVLKLVLWLLSQSSAIFASLADSLFDALSSGINLLAVKFSLQPPDREHRFGHFKAQALAALLQSGFIGGSALLLMVHGIARANTPQQLEYVPQTIVFTALITVLTVLLVLYQGRMLKLTSSDTLRSDRLHYLSDVLLNLVVLASLVLGALGYERADGMCTILIALCILGGALKIGYDTAQTLLDRSLDAEENAEIAALLKRQPKVLSVHNLKTRRAGPQIFIQSHLVMEGSLPLKLAHGVTEQAERALRERYPHADISLHMEPDSAESYADTEIYADTEADAQTPAVPDPTVAS